MALSKINAKLVLSSKKIKVTDDNLIGEGGFGLVYKIQHPDWGTVAMKRPKIDWTMTARGKEEKMLLEIDNQANLRHPSIMQVMGVVWEPSFHAIIMEYMEHGDLMSFQDNYPNVGCWTKVHFLSEIAAGISYMHSLRPHCIVHGDLKAMNVFLNKNLTAKIGDFGTSTWRTYASQMSTTRQTSPNGSRSMAATFAYLCPEGHADIHAKTTTKFDVYSFGIMIYDLFSTGNPAFDKLPLDKISNAVLQGRRPNESCLSSDMLEEMKKLMKECWRQDPSERPTFREILEILLNLTCEPRNKGRIDSAMVQLIHTITFGASTVAAGFVETDGRLNGAYPIQRQETEETICKEILSIAVDDGSRSNPVKGSLSDKNLCEKLSTNIAGEWIALGVHLDMGFHHVQQFELEYPRQLAVAILKMLVVWRDRELKRGLPVEEILSNLKGALAKVDRRDLIESLEKVKKKKVPTATLR